MHESVPALRDTILALARRYDFEEGHSLQDERLALRLFDETAGWAAPLGQHPSVMVMLSGRRISARQR